MTGNTDRARSTVGPSSHPGPIGEVTGRASIARVYDYWLGGKYNLAVDRELADKLLDISSDAATLARENRAFLVRATRYVAKQGIQQYVDIGSGLPTSPNVHEVARTVVPGARVVYVDRDPIVLAHGRALLEDAADGVAVVDGDMREPDSILATPALRQIIDFTEPVCVLLVSVLHFLTLREAERAVARFTRHMAAGSFLVISAGASSDRQLTERFAATYTPERLTSHSPDEIASWFRGFELAEPGLVEAQEWRPDQLRSQRRRTKAALILAGVGRKSQRESDA